jgi:hypothetical protein
MYYATDRRTAERVLVGLRSARLGERAATLASLQRIRNEAACERADDHLRMQAWMSIRKLYDACKAAPTGDLKPLWHEAIARTEAWRASMR